MRTSIQERGDSLTFDKCNDVRKECFARDELGLCERLTHTYDKKKLCPFYKTQEEYDRGRRKK